MSKCVNCNVKVEVSNNKCPLCDYRLKSKGKSNVVYPKYEIKLNKNKKIFKIIYLSILLLIITYLGLISVFGSIKINILLVVLLSLGIPLVLISKNIFSNRITFGYKLLIIYASISTLLITIDGFTSFNKWSTTYVIPFMTITVALIFTMIAMLKKKLFREYIGYLIVTFFISFCPLILFVFSLSNSLWTSILALIYFILTTITLLIFSFSKFKDEIKKRFHF